MRPVSRYPAPVPPPIRLAFFAVACCLGSILIAAPVACTSRGNSRDGIASPSASSATTGVPSVSDDPTGSTKQVIPGNPPRTPAAYLTHASCGYGGTGVSPPNQIAIMPYFDVTAARRIGNLRVTHIEILDASGATVARAVPPIRLRVADPSFPRDRDHNEITKPFSGSISAGATVRLRAEADLTPFTWRYSDRLRYRATVTTEEGAPALNLVGPLDNPWATAGPAPVP